MAIIEFFNRHGKISNSPSHLKNLCSYSIKPSKANENHITCYNCVKECAFEQFMNTKLYFSKTSGRNFIHFTQSFSPQENITLDIAHELACKLIQQYSKRFEIIVATHKDTKHIHTHFIINSVSFLDGKKFQQSKHDLEELKNLSDKLCLEYGLSVIPRNLNQKNRHITRKEYITYQKNQSWKAGLEKDLEYCMKHSNNKYEFVNQLENLGYKVKWTKERKNITYTTPNNMRIRDNKISSTFSKNNLEYYFNRKKTITNIFQDSSSIILDTLSNVDNDTKHKIRNLSDKALREEFEKRKNSSIIEWDELEL